jgi:glycosyltransferase involved in cell wall biosynthesis
MKKLTGEKAFSICVLTFNRGDKALNVAKTLLPELDDNWELLFLDNASNSEVETYTQLAELADNDQRIRYVRHESNRGFHRNYLACFEMASAPYIMVMSDEDFANPTMIREVLPLLHSYPGVGIMRGSMIPLEGVAAKNSYQRSDVSLIHGEEALLGYAFSNNYFSGTIYHRQLLIDLGLIDRLSKNIDVQKIYPHLYLELLACAVADVVTTAKVCCFEGRDQPMSGNISSNYAIPYSFGSRVDQFIVLRDAVMEAVGLIEGDFDWSIFVNVYLRLCEKYFFLITQVNSPMYIQHKIHPGLLHQAMLYVCGGAISMYPELTEFQTYIFEEIQKLHHKYEPYQ